MKSNIGISVGLLGAGVFLGNLFGGVLVSLLILVYVTKFEDNPWIKHMAIKASILTFFFTALVSVIGLLPDGIGIINNLANIFNSHFSIKFVSSIAMLLKSLVYFIETILFILLASKALSQNTIKIKFAEKLIDEHYRKFQEKSA